MLALLCVVRAGPTWCITCSVCSCGSVTGSPLCDSPLHMYSSGSLLRSCNHFTRMELPKLGKDNKLAGALIDSPQVPDPCRRSPLIHPPRPLSLSLVVVAVCDYQAYG